jgi:uncharacterized damage-inducible protein DinB
MNPRIKLIVDLYNVNQGLALKSLGQAKPENLHVRPLDKGNSVYWVFAHITAYRYTLAKALGLDESFTWSEMFKFGSEPLDPAGYPSIDEIKSAFLDISEKLKKRFETVSEADLTKDPLFTIPGIEESFAGTLAFLSLHESYHVGQLAYLQRLHGGEKLIG